jgi:hypothetical protein
MSIIMLTTARYWSLSWAKLIQFIPFHPVSYSSSSGLVEQPFLSHSLPQNILPDLFVPGYVS